MPYLSEISSIVGISSALFSLLAWLKARGIANEMEKEKARQCKKISVELNNGSNKLELPVPILRSQLSRAEILGRIGMVPRVGESIKFELKYLNSQGFFSQLNQLAEGAGDGILSISCSDKEFEQFDLEEYQRSASG